VTTCALPDVEAVAARFEPLPADEVLAWALETFGSRLAVVTAFQAEGMVILDLARRIDPGVRVVTIDTGRLPQETHDFIEQVRVRLGVDVEIVAPDAAAVEAMVRREGPNLFKRDVALRRLCCHVRKVEPLARALRDADAWVSGLRRDQGPSRAGTAKVEHDAAHQAVKVNPLADWTRDQVWAYVDEHHLPVHPLYAEGYASIGCAPCARPVRPGEDERAGRWWWEAGADRECGLHHATPSERFDGALATLRADLAARDRSEDRGMRLAT
jgi:phosphoadenosine phosphosulfate reductase